MCARFPNPPAILAQGTDFSSVAASLSIISREPLVTENPTPRFFPSNPQLPRKPTFKPNEPDNLHFDMNGQKNQATGRFGKQGNAFQ
jgi:hypothetical protein